MRLMINMFDPEIKKKNAQQTKRASYMASYQKFGRHWAIKPLLNSNASNARKCSEKAETKLLIVNGNQLNAIGFIFK